MTVSPTGSASTMKPEATHVDNHDTVEALNDSTLKRAAERGQAATDKYDAQLPMPFQPVPYPREASLYTDKDDIDMANPLSSIIQNSSENCG
jgi:hypothetical protein